MKRNLRQEHDRVRTERHWDKTVDSCFDLRAWGYSQHSVAAEKQSEQHVGQLYTQCTW